MEPVVSAKFKCDCPLTTNIPQAAARPLAQMKPKEQIAYLLKSKQGEIAKMLPKHLNAERLLKVAQIAATTTPDLAKCDVASLMGAIGQCGQMGLGRSGRGNSAHQCRGGSRATH